MKTPTALLRQLIKEELLRLREGSWQVTFTEKNGAAGQPRIFAGDNAEKLARMYAKGVKNGVAAPIDAVVPATSVQRVRDASLDDLKASAKAYRDKHWNPHKGSGAPGPWRRDDSGAENAAELESEMWANARAAGQSSEDTWADIDYERSRRR